MTREEDVHSCPFCGFKAAEYDLLLHIETYHAEGESGFVPVDESEARTSEEELYAECPIEGCGEVVEVREMDDHVDFHAQEEDLDGAATPRASKEKAPQASPPSKSSSSHAHGDSKRSSSRDKGKNAHAIHKWHQILSMPGKRPHASSASESASTGQPGRSRRRLGKAELGKYAHEKRMPDWLIDLLKKDWGIKASGVVPVLRQLLEQSPTTAQAYLCHPCVQHVSKLKREGGFCGYRNIQMQASYMAGVRFEGAQHFKNRMPTIFEIQAFIEAAWDQGINARGRIETGGVRDTRKFIGTPEAQAVFVSLGVPIEVMGFKDKEPGKSESRLFKELMHYFESGIVDPEDKVHATNLPPIYFQHVGHSMTIVGIERQITGHINLLVFDPMFHDAAPISKLVGQTFTERHPDKLLKPYRRGNHYLKKFREFEILRLKGPFPDTPV